MIPQIILYTPILLLSLILAGEMFIDYKSINKWLKCILILLIILGNAFSIYQQEKERREDQAAKDWYAQANAAGLGSVSEAIANLKGKDDPLKMNNFETGTMFLDRNFLRLRDVFGTDNMVSKDQYLTIYFDEVNKIPNFYTMEEWEETENLIYTNMIGQIDSYFAVHGNSSMAKFAEKEFSQERSKLIKAKERWFRAQPNPVK
jgi:hypothetical protein